MNIGITKEMYPGEQRVAVIPQVIPRLTAAGFTVLMEEGAGRLSGFTDQDYRARGAAIVSDRQIVFDQSDYIFQVHALNREGMIDEDDLSLMHEGQVLIGLLNPLGAPTSVKALADHMVTAFALELMPRIARAQSMDVLSSMASIAGYKAIILAADHLPRLFPLLMTAAGTILPAHVFIIGAGVAGLQAIATARRLGALVQAWDIRGAAKEQVESLGAKFLDLPAEAQDAETGGGYARAMDEAFYLRQRELMTKAIMESNVVVTSAAVFGSKAPILITEEMVQRMSPGTVIIDLAGEQGGNCELTESCKIVLKHDVTIIAPENLASTVPYHASQMFANNVVNFILHLTGNGKILPANFNLDDQIIRETMITRDGRVIHPAVNKLLEPATASQNEMTGG
ncbi:MAG: NAD(P)(+) transhydrogenase (Re/Si-specific) subunit alpha [Deltaproteobacteria bacterium HGW-Deltaproteobacteria-6]|nr:MAG: NAD(P)(+) transhydrogenase (Re/Si-specific) subunit alpha [Deltaproteobacteria bacterium HGW-Deltaproteobacteria-6]